jgi:hypothetical protein
MTSASVTDGTFNLLPRFARESKKMIRYTIFIAIVIGSAATAIANVNPVTRTIPASEMGASIVYKTSAAPAAPIVLAMADHHLKLQKCALEDCSDTPQ